VDGAADSADRVQAELGVPAVAISSRTGEGLDVAGRWFQPRKTVALVGSSGVGKSTLLNRLAGEELMVTQEIREDDARGRHTTTHRELFLLASGALVLDTPGMREFGVWDADDGVDETFAEIVELSDRCRFADCSHKFEPGCEVRAAVADGRLDAGRLKSYKRLAHELADRPPPRNARIGPGGSRGPCAIPRPTAWPARSTATGIDRKVGCLPTASTACLGDGLAGFRRTSYGPSRLGGSGYLRPYLNRGSEFLVSLRSGTTRNSQRGAAKCLVGKSCDSRG
jgi:ribosome small subunit-dependent GTPase A